HRRQRAAPVADRRGRRRAQNFPRRYDNLQRAKAAFVDRREGTHQALEGDARRRDRAGLAGIDRARHLAAAFREVDGHLAAADEPAYLERTRSVEIDAVAVENRLGFVRSGLDARDLPACERLGVIADRAHRAQENLEAVAADELRQAPLADAARGDLRAHV